MLPSFETGRLILHSRSLRELKACLEMDRDPQVTKFIPGPWHDPDSHCAFVLERMSTCYPKGLGYWSVFNPETTGQFLGWVMLIPCDDGSDDVEIGWRFTTSSWGHGFASEAARPILEHGLKTIGLKRVVAQIDMANIASQRVAEKIGMCAEELRNIYDMQQVFYTASTGDI